MNAVPTSTPPPPSVLLIEDDPDQAALLTRWLDSAGPFDVRVASDGAMASRLLWSRPWSLVVSDIQLPGVDGLSLLGRFRSAFPTTPFVLISSRSTIDDAHTALRLHASDFLPKPLNRDAFLSCATALARAEVLEAEAERRPEQAVRDHAAGMAETLATSMTLAAGVADILIGTAARRPLDARASAQYAGMLNQAATGLEDVLTTLRRIGAAAGGASPLADACDVAREAMRLAGPRLASAGVRTDLSAPGGAVVACVADHVLRTALHSTLVAISENAAICGLQHVDVAVLPVGRTVYVDVGLDLPSNSEPASALRGVLGILASESVRLGVRCLVDHAATRARLRFTLPRFTPGRTV